MTTTEVPADPIRFTVYLVNGEELIANARTRRFGHCDNDCDYDR